MQETYNSQCPKCGEELDIVLTVEKHKVHNGIGMQTVAQDEWIYPENKTCDCHISRDQLDEMMTDSVKKYEDDKSSYYADKVDELKDEGRI